MEKRFRSFDIAIRDTADPDKPRQLVGYACVFDSPSVDLGGFTEIIKPGAFTDALTASDLDVVCNVDHDNCRGILGRTKSGTLRLSQDDHGLAIECDLPDTQLGRDTIVSMQRGDLSQMSFCFIAHDEQFTADGQTREVFACSIHDVSLVVFPAYQATEAELRSKRNQRFALMRRQLEVREKEFLD